MISLSILVPVYNEENRLPKLFSEIDKLSKNDIYEVVFVNDGSTDGSREMLKKFSRFTSHRTQIVDLETNKGKGFAITQGLEEASATHAIILDADLELLPSEIPMMMKPIIEGQTNIVVGYREFTSQSSFTYLYVLGNKLISNLFGVLFNVYISDVMCGFKVLPTKLWRDLKLKQNDYSVEPEILAKCLALGFKPWEVKCSYFPRTRKDGKGITTYDGLKIFFKLFYMRIKNKPAIIENFEIRI